MFGMTRAIPGLRQSLARAALEAVCYQTRDLYEAMHKDWRNANGNDTVLRVDGGMVASDWTMQRLSDLLDAPVDRPTILETTALGVALACRLEAPASGPTRRRSRKAGRVSGDSSRRWTRPRAR
jgi:glycerol kinase